VRLGTHAVEVDADLTGDGVEHRSLLGHLVFERVNPFCGVCHRRLRLLYLASKLVEPLVGLFRLVGERLDPLCRVAESHITTSLP
jgi:hypothetical protein